MSIEAMIGGNDEQEQSHFPKNIMSEEYLARRDTVRHDVYDDEGTLKNIGFVDFPWGVEIVEDYFNPHVIIDGKAARQAIRLGIVQGWSVSDVKERKDAQEAFSSLFGSQNLEGIDEGQFHGCLSNDTAQYFQKTVSDILTGKNSS